MYSRSHRQRRQFCPYVIQIDNNSEVLYVNYATDINQAFDTFLRRHPRLPHSTLRLDLFDPDAQYPSGNTAKRACVDLIQTLEQNGLDIIAGGPLHNDFWQVYVIEIEGNPQHLYVGETNYPVEKRFQQHIYKFNPARVLLRYHNFDLAMHHAQHVSKLTTKEDSLRAESQLAQELRNLGYKVEGGH